jgi:hypothetical protein
LGIQPVYQDKKEIHFQTTPFKMPPILKMPLYCKHNF